MVGWEAEDNLAKRANIVFESKEIEDWINAKPPANKDPKKLSLCTGIWGFAGSTKTGIALDCRTPQEVKDGVQLVVFDLDKGCKDLVWQYHKSDPNIKLLDPVVHDENMSIDYEATFYKMKAAATYYKNNISKMKVKAIILDGADKFLKMCEYSTKEDANVGVADDMKWKYWGERNRKFTDVLEVLKGIPVDLYVIAHAKMDDEAGEAVPNWLHTNTAKTEDMFSQIIKCDKEVIADFATKETTMKATIVKCRTNLGLEGKVYTVAKVLHDAEDKTTTIWKGLQMRQEEVDGVRSLTIKQRKG